MFVDSGMVNEFLLKKTLRMYVVLMMHDSEHFLSEIKIFYLYMGEWNSR